MKYAMVCQNIVIDVIYTNKIPYYPPTPEGYEIVAVELTDEQQVSCGMTYIDNIFGGEYQPTPEPEPTQLDRIEAAVTAKNQDIAQAAMDTYTLELIEGGIL